MIAIKNNETLSLNILFNGVNPHQIPLNVNGNKTESIKEGEIIFSSGDESNFVYLVISGKVKIKENGVKKLKYKRENEFFGENEIIKNTQRNSSAMAETDVVVYKINKVEFKKLLDSLPSVKQNLIDFGNVSEEDFSYLNQEDNNSSAEKDSFSNEITTEETVQTENNKVSEPKEFQKDSELPDYLKEFDEFEDYSHPEEPEIKNKLEVPEEETQNKKPEIKEDDFQESSLFSDEENFEFTEKDDSFLDADFVYESPSLNSETDAEALIDETFQEQIPESEKLTPVEDEISPILDEKVALKNFNMILNQISANQNLDLTVQSILKNFLQLTGSDRGIIFLFDEKKEELVPEFNIGGKPEIPSVKMSEGITGKAASSKKFFFISNPESDARYVGSFDNPFEFSAQNVIYLPLLDNQLDLQGFATLSFNEETLEDNFRRQLKIYSILAGESILLSKQLALIEGKKHLSVIGDVSKFLLGDIKSPMLTIKHYTSIISRFDIPEEIKRVITLLTMQANSVLDLLQSTSDFAEKRVNIKKSPNQLNDLLNNILDLLSEFVESKNIKLFKKFAQNCTVNIDARKFHVAVYELIKYASAELPSGGKIFFSTEFLGKEVQIRIYNEGKFQQPERFPLVSRGDLSLDIAEFFLKAMGANLNVAEKSNGGVIFIISIPVTSN